MTDQIIVALIGVFGVTLGSNGLWEYIKTKKKRTPAENMTLALGRDRLLFLSKHYLDKGYIPLDELKSFTELGDAYIEMKGNTEVKTLYYETLELPKK